MYVTVIMTGHVFVVLDQRGNGLQPSNRIGSRSPIAALQQIAPVRIYKAFRIRDQTFLHSVVVL